MTLQLFSKMTGIVYTDVQKAVLESEIHVHGKRVEYSTEGIQTAVKRYLQKRERRLERELAQVRREICKASNLQDGWV